VQGFGVHVAAVMSALDLLPEMLAHALARGVVGAKPALSLLVNKAK
jgi:hypothetical protein